jgi:hypothetical protein
MMWRLGTVFEILVERRGWPKGIVRPPPRSPWAEAEAVFGEAGS